MSKVLSNRATGVTQSLGVAWLECLRDVLSCGVTVPDGPELLREVRNYSCTIATVEPQDPLLQRFADQQRIQLMYEKYRSLAILEPYKISYGALLYDNQGIDQIAWVVRRLEEKMETKSATIGLHTPGASELSCLSLLDFKVREQQLHMTCVYRSQNVYASQPGNLLALRRVQERVASKTGAMLGCLDLVALSAHIYESDLEIVTRILTDYDEVRRPS